MKKIVLFVLFATFLFGGMPKFLMPDEAFIPHAKVNDSQQIELDIELGKEIYVYEDKIDIKLQDAKGLSIADIQKPESVKHEESQVYLESPKFLVSLKNDGALSGEQKINVVFSFQGCSEQGLCYEPQEKTFSLSIDASKLQGSKAVKTEPVTETKELSQADSIASTIGSGNIGVIILTFLGFGILLSLTPCVFPMIPIISGLIVSQGEGLTTKRAFFLSVVYVLAMAVAYTIAGVLAGLFGSNLQATLQNPYVIYAFSAVFVALALSMFGFYELKLPDSLVTKVSSSNKKGGVIGVAIMGFLSALIVGPCVAAPLAGALVYIGQTGDAVLGGIALFAMSIGMGLPLIIVGVSAGKFMPRPGAWMTMVTAIFGIIMLGVAIWMLDKVVAPEVTTLLFALLGIGSSIYFGVFEAGVQVFRKTVAVVLFIYSASLFIGVLAGGGLSMTQPLGFLAQKTVVAEGIAKEKHSEFKVITSIAQLDKELEKNKGKRVLLDFSAEWCTACKEFEEVTFSNTDVKNKMDQFVLIRADVTKNGADEKALSKKYGIFGPPAILFFNKDSKLLESKTIVGFMEPQTFLEHLNKVGE